MNPKRIVFLVYLFVAILLALYLWTSHVRFERMQAIAATLPAGAGAVSKDGWISYSTGRGTSSHHGGVRYWASDIRWSVEHGWLVGSAIPALFVAALFVVPFTLYLLRKRRLAPRAKKPTSHS